jgi:hypothetical protein
MIVVGVACLLLVTVMGAVAVLPHHPARLSHCVFCRGLLLFSRPAHIDDNVSVVPLSLRQHRVHARVVTVWGDVAVLPHHPVRLSHTVSCQQKIEKQAGQTKLSHFYLKKIVLGGMADR